MKPERVMAVMPGLARVPGQGDEGFTVHCGQDTFESCELKKNHCVRETFCTMDDWTHFNKFEMNE